MCGHVGITGDMELKDEATLKRMLVFDYFRGPDSTGLAAIRKNKEVKIAKIPSHPMDLFDSKKFVDALSAYNSVAFIGHNRFATKGKVNGLNAHPYEYGHIIGAHNGTLTVSSWKKLEEILGEETEVDSMAIFACIEKVGIEKTVSVLEGAWALVWADLEEGTINFLRNKERPLWNAWTEGCKRMLWASEYPILDNAVKLAPVAYTLYETKEGYTFWPFDEDYLYSYKFDDLMKGSEKPPCGKIKKIKGKGPTPVTNYGGANGNFTVAGGTTTLTKKPPTRSGLGDTAPKIFDLEGSALNPLGDFYNEKDFEIFKEYDCSYCAAEIDYSKPGITIWDDDVIVLCPACTGNGEHSRIYTSKELPESVLAKENIDANA